VVPAKHARWQGTLLKAVRGAQLPAPVNLASTAAVKEAVHDGLGVSLVLPTAAVTH
jgi:hypothetical protein